MSEEDIGAQGVLAGASPRPEDYEDIIGAQPRSPQQAFRLSANIVGGIVAVGALLMAYLTYMFWTPWARTYTTDWVLVAMIAGLGPFAFFKAQDLRRTSQIDEHFPDFLRDLAEGARSGLTIPRAIVSTARGSYGALTPEIRRMAAQVQWGVDFPAALTRFAERNPTPLIERTVSLILEAKRSGGSLTEILAAAASDARELKLIVAGRNAQLQSYGVVIWVIFLVFLGIIVLLQAKFIPAFGDAVHAVQDLQGNNTALGDSPDFGALQLKSFDPVLYHTWFFHASVIQAILGGLMGGVLTRGKALSWLVHCLAMTGVAWAIFRLLG
jgi:flagellar protein FlaJ